MISPLDHPSRQEPNAVGIPCRHPLRDAQAPSKQQQPPLAAQTSNSNSSSRSGSSFGVLSRASPHASSSRRGRLALPVLVAVLSYALAGPIGALAQEEGVEEEGGSSSAGLLVLNLIGVAVLVVASGLFSGLTLGLLGLDKIGLEIISNGDEPRMAAFAKVGCLTDKHRRLSH